MINLNLKPNEDCELCDHEYICFDCEKEQVKKQYPNAKWELPDWIINNKYEDQEIIKQKLLKPIYNGCNDSFYLLWKNKHDEYVNKCFNEKNK